MHVPPLPVLEQSPAPRLIDGLRVLSWLITGYVHTVRRSGRQGRARWLSLALLYSLAVAALVSIGLFVGLQLAQVLALPWWLMAPVGLSTGALLASWTVRRGIHGGDRRAYMTPSREAFLSVRRTDHDWQVENLFSQHPGQGQAAHLWSSTIPALIRMADAHQVTVTMTAINERMAIRYMEEVEGLTLEASRTLRPPAVPLIRRPRTH